MNFDNNKRYFVLLVASALSRSNVFASMLMSTHFSNAIFLSISRTAERISIAQRTRKIDIGFFGKSHPHVCGESSSVEDKFRARYQLKEHLNSHQHSRLVKWTLSRDILGMELRCWTHQQLAAHPPAGWTASCSPLNEICTMDKWRCTKLFSSLVRLILNRPTTTRTFLNRPATCWWLRAMDSFRLLNVVLPANKKRELD